jgi:hypothetical protein
MKKYLILLTLFAVFSQGSAQSRNPNFIQNFPKSSYTAEADSLAQNQHLIAIVPPAFTIETAEEIDIRALLFQQESESKDFQKEMYSWMRKRKKQGRITAEIQDIDTTDARLRRAGYYNDSTFTPIEICQILGVDGVIISNYTLNKSSGIGQAVELGLLGAAVNEASGLHYVPVRPLIHSSLPLLSVSMGIHDFKTKKMIWDFDHTLTVGVSTTAHIVNVLMSDKSRKMPYIIK